MEQIPLEQPHDATNVRWTITHVTARDFKCLEFVEVTPEPGRPLVLIHGPNRTGKTALIDALCAVFRGKRHRPTAPIRDGQETSRITAQLAAGETVLDLTCRISDKSQSIEIKRQVDGVSAKLNKPQSILDGLTTALMFNPLVFANASGADQIKMLYEAIGQPGALEAAREVRREVLAKARDAAKDIARLEPLAKEPAAPPGDADAAAETIRRSSEVASRREATKGRIGELERDKMANTAAINANRTQIDDARKSIAALESRIAAAEQDSKNRMTKNASTDTAIAKLKTQLGTLPADVTAADLQAAMATRDAHARHGAVVEQTTANLKALKAKRLELATAERAKDAAQVKLDKLIGSTSALPPGVGITDDNEVTYNGRPLSNLSGSERILLSAAIAAAMNSKLADMFLDEIGVLDDETLTQLVDFATKHGLRLWATDTDPRNKIDAQRVPMPESNTSVVPEPDTTKTATAAVPTPSPKIGIAPTPELPVQDLLDL
jgi:DNA repair exonuclease SbcCD ATPase subunit